MKRLCIHDVRLLDGLGSDYPSADVFIEDGWIRDVRIPSAAQPVADWKVFTGQSRTLMPGLIDGHVHLLFDSSPQAPWAMLNKPREQLIAEALVRARSTLQAGITAVRDLSGAPKATFSLREVLSGEGGVPRIYDCLATLTAQGGFGKEVALELTQDNIEAVIHGLADRAAMIKVLGDKYDPTSPDGFALHFNDETFARIGRACRDIGKPLDVHAKARGVIRQCLKFGAQSLEHGVRAEAEDLKEMAAQGIYLNATFQGLKCRAQNQPNFDEFDRVISFYPLARDLGVRLTLGSDSGAIFTPHAGALAEIEFMVQAGLTAHQVIVAATSLNARRIGDESIGAVAVSRKADLLLIDGDPLQDIASLRTGLIWVMKDGEIVHKIQDLD